MWLGCKLSNNKSSAQSFQLHEYKTICELNKWTKNIEWTDRNYWGEIWAVENCNIWALEIFGGS